MSLNYNNYIFIYNRFNVDNKNSSSDVCTIVSVFWETGKCNSITSEKKLVVYLPSFFVFEQTKQEQSFVGKRLKSSQVCRLWWPLNK